MTPGSRARRLAVVLLATTMLQVVACGPRNVPLPEGTDLLARLALRTADGKNFQTAELADKVVVVNFWSPG